MGGASLTLSNATLDGNEAVGGNEGGAAVQPAAFVQAVNAFGGALYISAGTDILTGVTLNNNSALAGGDQNFPIPQGLGGAVYVAAGNVTLSSDTVEGNQAGGINLALDGFVGSGNGGAIYVAGGTVTLCRDTVEFNTASNGDASGTAVPGAGGGIYIASGATVYIDSFTVANTINNTDSSGLNGPTANIDGTYILQNC
jgi:hypothetical protein